MVICYNSNKKRIHSQERERPKLKKKVRATRNPRVSSRESERRLQEARGSSRSTGPKTVGGDAKKEFFGFGFSLKKKEVMA